MWNYISIKENTPYIKIKINQNFIYGYNKGKPSLLLEEKAIIMGWLLPSGNLLKMGRDIKH